MMDTFIDNSNVYRVAPSRVAYLGTLRRSKGAPQGEAVRPQRYPNFAIDFERIDTAPHELVGSLTVLALSEARQARRFR